MELNISIITDCARRFIKEYVETMTCCRPGPCALRQIPSTLHSLVFKSDIKFNYDIKLIIKDGDLPDKRTYQSGKGYSDAVQRWNVFEPEIV